MADHSHNTPGGHPAMDYAEHEGTYKGFIHFSEVGTVACLALVTALAVGGTKHAWGVAIAGTLASLIAAGVGIASKSIGWRAPAVVLVVLLLALAVM
ncbi:MAG: aa3-type cytochrome c oxidase subunit IV [Bosea sp. (in: a-proteobacteria)]